MNLSALSAKCPSSIENVFMDLILVAGLAAAHELSFCIAMCGAVLRNDEDLRS